MGFPIQRSPDQWIFAPPRSLSQLITSFIALGAKASALCSFCLASSDVIALTPDGLLVFFLSLLSQCLVFVSILRLTYHQEMNVLHMRFSRYSAQQNQNARRVLALRSVFLFCCIGCLLATEAASLPMCGLAHFSNKAVPCKSFYSVSTLSPYLID